MSLLHLDVILPNSLTNPPPRKWMCGRKAFLGGCSPAASKLNNEVQLVTNCPSHPSEEGIHWSPREGTFLTQHVTVWNPSHTHRRCLSNSQAGGQGGTNPLPDSSCWASKTKMPAIPSGSLSILHQMRCHLWHSRHICLDQSNLCFQKESKKEGRTADL